MSANCEQAISKILGERARRESLKDHFQLRAGTRKYVRKMLSRAARRQCGKDLQKEVVDLSQPDFYLEDADPQTLENLGSLILEAFEEDPVIEFQEDDEEYSSKKEIEMEMALMPGETIEMVRSRVSFDAEIYLRNEVRNTRREKAFAVSNADEHEYEF